MCWEVAFRVSIIASHICHCIEATWKVEAWRGSFLLGIAITTVGYFLGSFTYLQGL